MASSALLKLEGALESGAGFRHKTRGVDSTVSQVANFGQMGSMFLSLSLVFAVKSHASHSQQADPNGYAEDGQNLSLIGFCTLHKLNSQFICWVR